MSDVNLCVFLWPFSEQKIHFGIFFENKFPLWYLFKEKFPIHLIFHTVGSCPNCYASSTWNISRKEWFFWLLGIGVHYHILMMIVRNPFGKVFSYLFRWNSKSLKINIYLDFGWKSKNKYFLNERNQMSIFWAD